MFFRLLNYPFFESYNYKSSLQFWNDQSQFDIRLWQRVQRQGVLGQVFQDSRLQGFRVVRRVREPVRCDSQIHQDRGQDSHDRLR